MTFASFNEESIDRLRAGSPEGTQTSAKLSELIEIYGAKDNPSKRVKLPRNIRAQIPTKLNGLDLTEPSVIEAAERHGVPIDYWTINDPAEMHRLLDLGAAGIITDELAILKNVLEARGQFA